MFSRRRLSLAVVTVVCLIAASGASAVSTAIDGPLAWTGVLANEAAPTVTITGQPTNPSNADSATFVFAASEPSTFECKLDGGAFEPCTSPKSYTGLGGGSHTFEVRASNPAAETGTATFTWTIDTVAPTASITVKPNSLSNDKSPSFQFTASEASTFRCKLDAAAPAPCSSPTSYSNLANGSHTFVAEATDAAGNVGVTGYSWTIDAAAPTVTIGPPKPPNPDNDTAPRFGFTASEPSTFRCKLDATAFAPCTSPQSYTALAGGPHTFVAEATDAAGNVGTASYNWTIDATAPTVTITVKPPNQSNDTSPSFGFTASEASTFRCGLDPATLAACTSPKTFNLTAGTYTFLVRATDGAGNVGAASYSWTIDTSPPTTSITAKPSNPSNLESPSFQFAASESATFECKLDGAAFASCATPKSYTALADGAHAFHVRATDRAGNPGPEAIYTWSIDTAVPTATITLKPSSASNTNSPTFAFIASESGTFTCRLDGGSFASCASPATYSSLADGPHTFAVRATDSAGNTGPEANHAWTIETRAPTAALASAPAALSNSSGATFAFLADEPSSFDCSVDGRGFEPCISPATYSGLGDGAHAFRVRAKDAVGNLSAPVGHSWAIDTTAPETTLAAAPTSGPATAATFAYAASEAATFECRLDGAPFTLCGSPKSYGGLGQGDHQFQVRAIDRAGNADATPSLHGWKIVAPAAKKVASALLSPKAGARVTRAPLLVWRKVSRAGYYNVQLFRGSRKVFSAWPTRTRLQLRMQWKFLGRQQRLSPGRYRWFVWPGYGNPRRYGALLGQSSFVMGRPARR